MKIVLFIIFFSQMLHAGTDGTTEPKTIWKKKEVTVCFGEQNDVSRTSLKFTRVQVSPYSTDQKKNIESSVTSQFTPEKTGISFIGWKDCSVTKSPDTILFMTTGPEAGGGSASMEYHGQLDDDNEYVSLKQELIDELGLLTYVVLSEGPSTKLSPEDRLKYIALHEFGHLAGLRHEHLRDEADNDPLCILSGVRSYERAFKSTLYASVYDQFSIMSYCYCNFIANHSGKKFRESVYPYFQALDKKNMSREGEEIHLEIGLSSNDEHALRCLYQYSEEVKNAICHSEFQILIPN